VFLHPVGSAGHVLPFAVSEARNVDAPYFMLRWNLYIFDKKRVGTCFAELVFFHLVIATCHVVHSGASVA
jgi:hypothetical protein